MRRTVGEGTIVQRADGRWAASLQVGGKRYWLYGKTRKEVVDRLQALRQQQLQGGLIGPSRLTLGAFLPRWLEHIALTCKSSTVHGYNVVVRCHLVPTLGTVKLQKLVAPHLVKLYQTKHQQGLSPRRVAIIHAVLHRALAEAVRWRLVARNVADDVSPPRQETAEPRVWSLDDVRQFVAVAETSRDRYAPALVLTLALGLRAAELLGLQWDSVDLERGRVTIERSLTWVGGRVEWGSPKSRAGRRGLPLPAPGRLALQALRRQQAQDRLLAGPDWKDSDGRVVTTSTGGVPSLNRLKDALGRLCARAEVPRLTVHQLRHQCASLLLASGADVKQVQHFLGHSRASTTVNVYAHQIRSGDGLAIILNAALGPDRQTGAALQPALAPSPVPTL